jgi:hypothetical protein
MTFAEWFCLANSVLAFVVALLWLRCSRQLSVQRQKWLKITGDLLDTSDVVVAATEEMRAATRDLLGDLQGDLAFLATVNDKIRLLFGAPVEVWSPEAQAEMQEAMGLVVARLDQIGLRLRDLLSAGEAD